MEAKIIPFYSVLLSDLLIRHFQEKEAFETRAKSLPGSKRVSEPSGSFPGEEYLEFGVFLTITPASTMAIQLKQQILVRTNRFSSSLTHVDEVVLEPSTISISPATAGDLHTVRIWGATDGVRDGDCLVELKLEIVSEEFTTASIIMPITIKVSYVHKLPCFLIFNARCSVPTPSCRPAEWNEYYLVIGERFQGSVVLLQSSVGPKLSLPKSPILSRFPKYATSFITQVYPKELLTISM